MDNVRHHIFFCKLSNEIQTRTPIDFRPKQVYEQVADQIRSLIMDGSFPKGSRLPSERDLAQQLNVSRPAVREAIGALQNMNLVVTRHGSGTYVNERALSTEVSNGGPCKPADLSPLDTLEVRLLLEPAVARLAAKRGQRDKEAEKYLQRMSSVHDIADPNNKSSGPSLIVYFTGSFPV